MAGMICRPCLFGRQVTTPRPATHLSEGQPPRITATRSMLDANHVRRGKVVAMSVMDNGRSRAAQPSDPPDFTRTGPGTLAGKYLRRFWLPVALLADVKPGRAKPIRILDEEFTYYRGESGRPHLIGFRCAHRGTQLSTGRVEGERLSCFYHGWTYDETGQCAAQPAEPESYAHKVQIPGYPSRDYLGVVFAYLGEGAPPPFPHLASFDRPGLIEAKRHLRTTSFFNHMSNRV